MKPNPGRCPDQAIGKRVRVQLAHGGIGRCDDSPTSKPGWAANDCRWTLTGQPHDIAAYEVVR